MGAGGVGAYLVRVMDRSECAAMELSRSGQTLRASLGYSFVGRNSGTTQIFKPAQHVIVPPGGKGEARPVSSALAIALDHLAS